MICFAFDKLSGRPPREPADVARRRELFARVLRPMRLRARELGYALGVHGSAERDLDVIAAPWVEGAVSAPDLALALCEVVGHELGFEPPTGWRLAGAPPRPHGRDGCSIHLVRAEEMTVGEDGYTDSPYIDLSILPRGAG